MNQPTLLIYHMTPQRMAALSAICVSMKVKPVAVSETETKVPIGLLTGSEEPMKVIREAEKRSGISIAGKGIDEEMIIMAGFHEKLFGTFLSMLRQNGLLIGLKAVETEENRYWNGEMLQEELKKERKAFQKR